MAEMAPVTTPAAAATAKPEVILHWLNASRSQRIVWLLQECKGIDHKIEVYKRVNMLAPESLKKVHPLGKSPVITVKTAGNPDHVISESGTLSEYLTDYFAQHLVPKRYKEGKEGQVGGETEEWMRYRLFMHYAEGSLMTMLLLALFVDQIRNAPGAPFFIKPITRTIASRIDAQFLTKNLDTHFTFLDSQVASSPNGGQYLCGAELTAADIMMSFPLIAAKGRTAAGDRTKYPNLNAYIDRLEKHPGNIAATAEIEKVTGEKLSYDM